MLLGLMFLQYSVQTKIIHEQGITFIPYQDSIPYITEVRKTISSNLEKANIELEGSNNYINEKLGENIEEFHIANFMHRVHRTAIISIKLI